MILEHPDLPPARVTAAVVREWGILVDSAEPAPVQGRGWHWTLGDEGGPQWFATLDVVRSTDERRTRLAAFESAADAARNLAFAVTPVHTRDGRVAVDLAPTLLLSLTPLLDGTAAGPGAFVDDAERTVVASMMGELHRLRRPRALPLWRPRIGAQSLPRRQDLERCLDLEEWTGGPWSVPTGRLVADARPVVRRTMRRFALLAAAVTGSAERWVMTHGEPHTANLVSTPDGSRLVSWGTSALAPRERDLCEVLGEAEGDDPWYAYVEAGGPPEPLSPDTVELFALQRHLSGIAEQVTRFSRPHEDTEDDRRLFGELEEQVTEVLKRWG